MSLRIEGAGITHRGTEKPTNEDCLVVGFWSSQETMEEARAFEYELDLPLGLIPQNPKRPCADSILLCDQVRTIDYRERNLEFKAKASRELVDRALDLLLTLLDLALAE